jgi:hypothetical protein
MTAWRCDRISAATPIAISAGCLPKAGLPIGQRMRAIASGLWPRAASRLRNRAHLVAEPISPQCRQSRATAAGGKGQGPARDCRSGSGGLRPWAHARPAVPGPPPASPSHQRARFRKPVGRRINPGHCQPRQGCQHRHQRTAHMARAPDPQRHLAAVPAPVPPSSPATRARSGWPHTCARAPVASSRFTASGIGRPSTARANTPASGRGKVDASKISVRRVTAPPQHWPRAGPSGTRSRVAVPPDSSSPRARAIAVPFQRPAANGAGASIAPDQHRRPRLARGRPVDRCNHNPGNPALRGDGVRQGGQVNHRAASARPSAHARRSRAHPAPDKPTHPHRPPPHPTAPSAPKCPA